MFISYIYIYIYISSKVRDVPLDVYRGITSLGVVRSRVGSYSGQRTRTGPGDQRDSSSSSSGGGGGSSSTQPSVLDRLHETRSHSFFVSVVFFLFFIFSPRFFFVPPPQSGAHFNARQSRARARPDASPDEKSTRSSPASKPSQGQNRTDRQ